MRLLPLRIFPHSSPTPFLRFYWVNGLVVRRAGGRPQKSRNKDRSFRRRSTLGTGKKEAAEKSGGRGRDTRGSARGRPRPPHGNWRTEQNRQQTGRPSHRDRGRAGLLRATPIFGTDPQSEKKKHEPAANGAPDVQAAEFSDLWKKSGAARVFSVRMHVTSYLLGLGSLVSNNLRLTRSISLGIGCGIDRFHPDNCRVNIPVYSCIVE